MSEINYQALREKAEKATCGVWWLEYGESRFDCDDALIHRDVVGYLPICRIEGAHPESGFDEDFQMEQQANAEFIAAANPATVLALLDERERNQQYIKRRDQENEDIALTVGKLRVELDAANEHIAELEALTTPRLPHPSPVVTDEMTPEMMRAVQLNSELGAYAASNLSGAYDLFSEFWKVACCAAMIQGKGE
ncbi:TPA: ead/Ea22-like family protein [Escherichia coli]